MLQCCNVNFCILFIFKYVKICIFSLHFNTIIIFVVKKSIKFFSKTTNLNCQDKAFTNCVFVSPVHLLNDSMLVVSCFILLNINVSLQVIFMLFRYLMMLKYKNYLNKH